MRRTKLRDDGEGRREMERREEARRGGGRQVPRVILVGSEIGARCGRRISLRKAKESKFTAVEMAARLTNKIITTTVKSGTLGPPSEPPRPYAFRTTALRNGTIWTGRPERRLLLLIGK